MQEGLMLRLSVWKDEKTNARKYRNEDKVTGIKEKSRKNETETEMK